MTDYSFDGYSYIHKYKVKQWIEDERALTQEELYSVIDYDDEDGEPDSLPFVEDEENN